jgi:alpha-2-macroglobulin
MMHTSTDGIDFVNKIDRAGIMLASDLREKCIALSIFTSLSSRKFENIYNESQKAYIDDLTHKALNSVNKALSNSAVNYYNTQEASYCLAAINEYNEQFNATAPNFKVDVKLDNKSIANQWFKTFNDKPLYKASIVNGNGRSSIAINKEGSGRYYYNLALNYAVDNNNDIDAGMSLIRNYYLIKDGKATLLKSGDEITQGDILLVNLVFDTASIRYHVVVDDSVLAGLEPLNPDLATTSIASSFKAIESIKDLKIDRENISGLIYSMGGFYHSEIGYGNVRFYGGVIHPGRYHLNYVAQAIASGNFYTRSAKAEEMYSPFNFGKSSGMNLQVLP